MKKPNETNFVTEIRLGEAIETSGPARFTLLELMPNGHQNRATLSIISDRTTKIKKVVVDAAATLNKWGLK